MPNEIVNTFDASPQARALASALQQQQLQEQMAANAVLPTAPVTVAPPPPNPFAGITGAMLGSIGGRGDPGSPEVPGAVEVTPADAADRIDPAATNPTPLKVGDMQPTLGGYGDPGSVGAPAVAARAPRRGSLFDTTAARKLGLNGEADGWLKKMGF